MRSFFFKIKQGIQNKHRNKESFEVSISTGKVDIHMNRICTASPRSCIAAIPFSNGKRKWTFVIVSVSPSILKELKL